MWKKYGPHIPKPWDLGSDHGLIQKFKKFPSLGSSSPCLNHTHFCAGGSGFLEEPTDLKSSHLIPGKAQVHWLGEGPCLLAPAKTQVHANWCDILPFPRPVARAIKMRWFSSTWVLTVHPCSPGGPSSPFEAENEGWILKEKWCSYLKERT